VVVQPNFESNELAEARLRAESWLAEFAPTIEVDTLDSPDACQQSIETVQRLRQTGPGVLSDLNRLGQLSDQATISTLQQAISQTTSLESDIRRRLALVEPGNKLGKVNLNELQGRLAERAARQEVLGEDSTPLVPDVIDRVTSEPNILGSLFVGLFGLGWTSFTTVHCIFMVGGMVKSFGPAGLLLLLFYSIFFAVGFGMLYATIESLSRHHIRLDGNELTVTKTLGGWVRTKKYVVDTSYPPEFRIPPVGSAGFTAEKEGEPAKRAFVLKSTEGKWIVFGTGMDIREATELLQVLRLYLKQQSALAQSI
jgi:hypothetical protein